ncbi:MAG: AtpZ/AtpI family protein [Acidobacteria bacterium]|nr:AtpZ/AtpI family protein [Acidobacteriota bacterium]
MAPRHDGARLKPGEDEASMLPRGVWQTVGSLGTVGLSFVLALIIGAWAGRWLDEHLGTSPWLFIVGFFLGLVAGILNVYRITAKYLK